MKPVDLFGGFLSLYKGCVIMPQYFEKNENLIEKPMIVKYEFLGKSFSLHTNTGVFSKDKIDDVEFCAIDATRAEEDFLKDAVAVAKESGANLITFCDSTSEMMPDEFSKFVTKFMLEGIDSGVMCEDKNGLAAANTIIAVRGGVNTVKTGVIGSITNPLMIHLIKYIRNLIIPLLLRPDTFPEFLHR